MAWPGEEAIILRLPPVSLCRNGERVELLASRRLQFTGIGGSQGEVSSESVRFRYFENNRFEADVALNTAASQP